jgi:hypothetical protein
MPARSVLSGIAAIAKSGALSQSSLYQLLRRLASRASK